MGHLLATENTFCKDALRRCGFNVYDSQTTVSGAFFHCDAVLIFSQHDLRGFEVSYSPYNIYAAASKNLSEHIFAALIQQNLGVARGVTASDGKQLSGFNCRAAHVKYPKTHEREIVEAVCFGVCKCFGALYVPEKKQDITN